MLMTTVRAVLGITAILFILGSGISVMIIESNRDAQSRAQAEHSSERSLSVVTRDTVRRIDYIQRFLSPRATNIRLVDSETSWAYFDLDGRTYLFAHNNYGGTITLVK
jgi:hypothetical protein